MSNSITHPTRSRLVAGPTLSTTFALVLILCAILLPAPRLSLAARTETPEAGTGAGLASRPSVAGPDAPARDENVTPHLLAAAYYNVGGNLSATLTLNNKGPQPFEAQPTFFSLSGERLDVPAVTVGANSFKVVDLREYALTGTPFEEGSLQVVYQGHPLEMGAQVKLVDAGRSLMFEEQLVEPAAMFFSTRLEGVWWLPSRGCDVRLVLSNTTDAPLPVTARAADTAPKQRELLTLTLAPHETRVLNLPQDLTGKNGGTLAGAFGVSLEHSGARGALLGRALIQEPEAGYSLSGEFIDPGNAKSSRLDGAGLRLGSAGGETLTPVAVARNVSPVETTLVGRVPYTLADGSAGVVVLPSTRLAPGEVKIVDVGAAIRRGGPVRGVASAGLEFEYGGEPGGIVMSALSASRNHNQVFRVPLINSAAMPSSTGGYPWFIEGNSSTRVYIKNTTGAPHDYI
ncbi:MAG: hypothetical protein LC754_01650, partial [Acidobacteria bacterium]|nr:hypothetical protein [Acidobacteriota bacterium]